MTIKEIIWDDNYSHFECHILATIEDNILHICDNDGKTTLTNAVSDRFIKDISKQLEGDFEEIFLYHPDNVHSIYENPGFRHLDKDRLEKDGFKPFIEKMEKEGYKDEM